MKSEAYDDLELGRLQVGYDADSCLGHHPDSCIYPSYPADEETAVRWTNREMLALMDAHIGPNFIHPILPSLEVTPLCWAQIVFVTIW